MSDYLEEDVWSVDEAAAQERAEQEERRRAAHPSHRTTIAQEQAKDGPLRPKIPEQPSSARKSQAPVVSAPTKEYEHFSMPAYPSETRQEQFTAYAPDAELDFHDIFELNRSIMVARNRLYHATQMLKLAQRQESDAKYEWKSAYNRALLQISNGTEKQRAALAEILTEEQYAHFLQAERLSDEALNFLRATREDLHALINLSHNMRAQMQIQ